MRLAAAVGLLHIAGSASAFCPSVSAARSLSPRPRAVPVLQLANIENNEFDSWWAARGQQMQRVDAPGALPLNTDSVALVLAEFVNSEFAKKLCKPG